MPEIQWVERKPTAAELAELRLAVGWGQCDLAAFEAGLRHSLYGVCALAEGKVIGTARIVGDGSTCFYIQDVIVSPAYQRMGVGCAMMDKIMAFIGQKACSGAVVGLMAACGKEAFYERFGFWKRPNENFGPGMMQFWGS